MTVHLDLARIKSKAMLFARMEGNQLARLRWEWRDWIGDRIATGEKKPVPFICDALGPLAFILRAILLHQFIPQLLQIHAGRSLREKAFDIIHSFVKFMEHQRVEALTQ